MSQVLSWRLSAKPSLAWPVLLIALIALAPNRSWSGVMPETLDPLPSLQQPAGLARDSGSGDLFIGDAATGLIWRRRAGQSLNFFARLPTDGPARLEELELDSAHGWLWAIASQAEPSSRPIVPAPAAALYRFDLASGRLQQRHLLVEAGAWHHLGDLVVASNGDVYLSHSYERPAVYRLTADDDQLAVFWRGGPQVREPHGIALDDAHGWLYLGHERGLLRIQLSTGVSENLALPAGTAINSCTSLHWYHGRLLALTAGTGVLQLLTLTTDADTTMPSRVLRSDTIAVLSRQQFPPRGGLVQADEFWFLAEQLRASRHADIDAQSTLQKLVLPH
ncbi:hypothetical protein HPT27_08380 [Permianibacter sp. IMCC34836]|uniref:hypothetical protein n=1 Tax=Permianibacter fluminis TaxID=2738515 RepID=UPI001553D460|nr:hypothetical protein [Permianibacter fluminis]NQD37038.1 hypothetical protein [Permianibacter fluminis]